MGDDGEDFGSALFEHVESALDRQESVGVVLLAEAFEEDGQIVVVVKLSDLHFPPDLVLGTVLDGQGHITAVVEVTELTGRDETSASGT